MVKPQVTITLGSSGQRVVKESKGGFDGGRGNAAVRSGSKRSLPESSRDGSDYSFNYSGKRIREDVSASNNMYSSRTIDSRLGPKDLRLKLMQKRLSRRIELEKEEHKKKELHEKVSRAIRSAESHEESLSRNVTSSRVSAQPLMDSMGSSYAPRTSNFVRTGSPDRVLRYSNGISTPRSAIDELPRISLSSMRTIDASRNRRTMMSDPLDSSRPRIPLPISTRGPVDKLVTELTPTTGGTSRSPYLDNRPLTVSSLLHSLGLEKYIINFRAEEIDMAVLRQMGERDLKDLGIPMGPRKKILLAVEAYTKRTIVQVRSNYSQMHNRERP